jgi:hypothetical protein
MKNFQILTKCTDIQLQEAELEMDAAILEQKRALLVAKTTCETILQTAPFKPLDLLKWRNAEALHIRNIETLEKQKTNLFAELLMTSPEEQTIAPVVRKRAKKATAADGSAA